MDIFESWRNKFDSWKMKGLLGYRGDLTWPNEKAAVAGATDLKILFIKIDYSFVQIQGADMKCYPM